MSDTKNFITGLYGCSCHPFTTWGECDAFHKQKLTTGQKVKQRHTGKEGEVFKISEHKGFVTVKYGDLKSDLHQEHVANLIKL